jgi:hypothetical protein
MAPPLKVETLPCVLFPLFPNVAKPSTLNKPVLALRMAPPPSVADVVLLEVKVLAPFKVVVPDPAVSIAPPPPVDELLANVDAPVMVRIPAFAL